MKSGLLMLYTSAEGNGSAAAFGQAFRALGCGLNVCIVQFVDGSWEWDKLTSSARLEGLIEVHACPAEFTWNAQSLEWESEAADRMWRLAREKVESEKYRMVVLDELATVLAHRLLNEGEVVNLLAAGAENLTVIVTGRQAPESLVEAADLVTEVKERKGPPS